jgi:hypothetical protein
MLSGMATARHLPEVDAVDGAFLRAAAGHSMVVSSD